MALFLVELDSGDCLFTGTQRPTGFLYEQFYLGVLELHHGEMAGPAAVYT